MLLRSALQQPAALHHVKLVLPLLRYRICSSAARRLSCSASAPSHQPSVPGVKWSVTYDAQPDLRGLSVDSIVVLAGGQTEDGGVPEWVERRLDAAFDLHQLNGRKCPVLLLGGGTPHKPPILDSRGFVMHEAISCAQYLASKGMATAPHMLKEVSSYDTVGNAYFSLTIHALPAGWRRIAVVTSDFHMPRTAALFRHMYRLAGQQYYGDADRFELAFVGVTDDGLFEPDVLRVRHEREAQSLDSWRKTAQQLQTMPQLHEWLHSTHLCYAVSRAHEFGKPTISDPKILASY